jgi:O-antigen ligase
VGVGAGALLNKEFERTPSGADRCARDYRSIQTMTTATDVRSAGRAAASRDYASGVDNFCFWAANLGLAWAPFWLGSNRPIAWYANAIYFGVLVLVLEGSRLLWPRPLAVPLRKVLFPVFAFIAVCVWIYVQAATWTPPQLHNPIWQLEGQGLDVKIPGSITINRSETAIALMRLLTEGAAFWLYLQLCRSPQRAYRSVQVVAFVGAVYAVYGIVAFYVFPGTILWLPKIYYLDSVTSTFINRNSYATYAGIGLVCALGVGLSEYVRRADLAGHSLVRQGAAFLAATAGPPGAWVAAAFVLAMALVLTGSRGGILSSIAGTLAFALLLFMRRRSARAGLAVFIALVTVGIAISTFGDLLAARLLRVGIEATDRLAVYRLTLLSILDSPWRGSGYGTFSTVFAMYRDSSVSPVGMWDKAHDTYLEIVQGLGIPAAALFFAMLLFFVARCAYGALTRKTSSTAPLIAASASVIVGLHSFVDFSMQIQAVALTWTALLGAGVAQSWSNQRPRQIGAR